MALDRYEVLVTDDSDNDTTQNFLYSKFPWVKWIKGPRRGPAANRNNGARHACGEWLAFTDDDCLPESGWLRALSSKMHESKLLEGCTLAEGQQSRLDEESPLNPKGGCLWSCNFAITTGLFNEVGGFDENFPCAALEDVDLRMRLEHLGYHPLFVDNAIVRHPWRLMKGENFIKRRMLSYEYFAKKHGLESSFRIWKLLFWMNRMRFFKGYILAPFWQCRGRGFWRAVRLQIVMTICEIKLNSRLADR